MIPQVLLSREAERLTACDGRSLRSSAPLQAALLTVWLRTGLWTVPDILDRLALSKLEPKVCLHLQPQQLCSHCNISPMPLLLAAGLVLPATRK